MRPHDHPARPTPDAVAPTRSRTIRVPLSVAPAPRRALNAGIVFTSGFAAIIALGTVLLMLPVAQGDGQWTHWLDAAFTAASAVSVTGLAVLDTGTHWSTFGHAVILALVQVGGLGFMIFSTFILRMTGRRAGLRQRLLLRDALGGASIGSTLTLARRVVLYSLIVEGIGAVLLTLAFVAEHPLPTAIWWGVFHAVSGFNSAGFDLTGHYQSMIPYQNSPLVLLTLSALFTMGGLSYAVVEDLVRRRSFQRLTLDSKLVLVVTFILLPVGTALLLFTERNNGGTFAPMPIDLQVLNAFFQSSVARSSGFSSVDVSRMTDGGLLVLMAMMMIGGSAGSTAGGIKVQTVGILVCATASAIRGLPDVVAFERRVPMPEVLRAIAVTVLSGTLVFLATFLLGLADVQPFLRELFEVVSAFATVGLSTGLSLETTPAGRGILIVLMFIGRLGPLTLAVALAEREQRSPLRWPSETVRIG